MDKKYIVVGLIVVLAIILFATLSGSSTINKIGDPDFDEEGICLDTTECFQDSIPNSVSFFVESSGSMNGFFRANKQTDFKNDVWSVVSSELEHLSDHGMHIVSNDCEVQYAIPLDEFRIAMNRGLLVSNQETHIPIMIKNIISSIDINKGQAAILISDMKYSPEKQIEREALMGNYTSDIRNLLLGSDAAFSLIAATSDYLDKTGNVAEALSPYYFLIIGHPTVVPWLRNVVATFVDDNKHYIEQFDFNMDYKKVPYSITSVRNGVPLVGQPTIYEVLDGNCNFTLNLDITSQRWVMADSTAIQKQFSISSKHGAKVDVTGIEVEVDNHADRKLKRVAKAKIKISVSGIGTSGDVLEWSLEPSETLHNAIFGTFLGAESEGELDKTYSMEQFMEGCLRGSKTKWQEKKNKILISTAD